MLFVAGALHYWQKCQRRCVFLAASLWLYLRFGKLIREGHYQQALNDDSQIRGFDIVRIFVSLRRASLMPPLLTVLRGAQLPLAAGEKEMLGSRCDRFTQRLRGMDISLHHYSATNAGSPRRLRRAVKPHYSLTSRLEAHRNSASPPHIIGN
jgi:hypothetical protein